MRTPYFSPFLLIVLVAMAPTREIYARSVQCLSLRAEARCISAFTGDSNPAFSHLQEFGFLLHVGREGTALKTETMYFSSPRQMHLDVNTSNFVFTEIFRYLGSIIHY